MNEQSTEKPAGCAPIWFGASILWLLIFAHILDDVRHGSENLLLLVIVPLLFTGAALSIGCIRWFWYQFPNLAPRLSGTKNSNLSIIIGLLISLAAATLWRKSALFIWFYDSGKIIVLIGISGLLLSYIYKVGGRSSVFVSLLAVALSSITAFLAFLIMALLSGGGKDVLAHTGFLASIGVPYVITVALYECYRKASTAS